MLRGQTGHDEEAINTLLILTLWAHRGLAVPLYAPQFWNSRVPA
jgi:hypothetical protein